MELKEESPTPSWMMEGMEFDTATKGGQAASPLLWMRWRRWP